MERPVTLCRAATREGMVPTRPLPSLLLALLIGACTYDEGHVSPSTGSAVPSASARALELTLGTYNVYYDAPGNPEILRAATTLDAEILLYQETNPAWEAALRAALSPGYQCVFHPPRKYLPEGLGVCSVHPIVSDELLASPLGWFPAQRVVVGTPGGPVEILNVHLRPAVAGLETWHATHLETRPLRKREMEAYRAHLRAELPTIVAGDFNDAPEAEVFALLAADGFVNALPRARIPDTTWHWPGNALEAQLDHVAFESNAFELATARVRKEGQSDHWPVVVRLRLSPR
jgi:endonuclease/exonuclease/phosphatase family metal-dependent hydrolase